MTNPSTKSKKRWRMKFKKLKKLMKRIRKGRKNGSSKACMVDTLPSEQPQIARSLAVGHYDYENQKMLQFIIVSNLMKATGSETVTAASTTALDALDFDTEPLRSPMKALGEMVRAETFRRVSSSFLRVADLQGQQLGVTSHHLTEGDVVVPNFHHPSSDAPPGVDFDPNEQWVALDNGAGSHAPIAPYAIEALTNFGLQTALDDKMWKGDSATLKFLKGVKDDWEQLIWPLAHNMAPIKILPAKDQNQVLVWSGNFIHGYYGSDLPAVRAAGLVNMSPKAMVDLLMDSERTKEYNEYSLGRKDLVVLQDNMDPDGPFCGITKIVESESQPPMIRKTIQLTTIMHVRELENHSGYIIISRAVHNGTPSILDPNLMRSEILINVNVIRAIENEPNLNFMINVNHVRSPMIPLFIAKRLGLAAAANFLTDMRQLGSRMAIEHEENNEE